MSICFSYKVDIWKRAAEQISHNQIAIVAQTSAENGWCAYQVTCKKKKNWKRKAEKQVGKNIAYWNWNTRLNIEQNLLW